VWVTAAGVVHGQIAVSRARTELASPGSSFVASVKNKSLIPLSALKVGNAVPRGVNLTSSHVLVLFSDKLLAFSQLTGKLVEELELYRPHYIPPPNSAASLFDTPAAGIVRDCDVDCLWIYTAEGQIARLTMTNEHVGSWKVAAAQGRFDLAVELSGEGEMVSRETILEAQAEQCIAGRDWESATMLYAKMRSKPVETVMLAIMSWCEGDEELSQRLLTEYLVRRLDLIAEDQPMQKTIISMLCVELYARRMTRASKELPGLKADFSAFILDNLQYLDLTTAVRILISHGRYDEVCELCSQAGDVMRAINLLVLSGQLKEALETLEGSLAATMRDPRLQKDARLKQVAHLLSETTPMLSMFAPRRISELWHDHRANPFIDIDVYVSSLVAFARGSQKSCPESVRNEAYQASTWLLLEIIRELNPQRNIIGRGNLHARDLLQILLELHAERGNEKGAEAILLLLKESSLPPLRLSGLPDGRTGTGDAHDEDDLGFALLACSNGRFKRLCVEIYSSLGLDSEAVALALSFDPPLAESHARHSSRRDLWLQVAARAAATAPPATAGDAAVGVAQRSLGVLRVEDVLPLVPRFSALGAVVQRAALAALREHAGAAGKAGARIGYAAVRTERLREDIAQRKKWREEGHGGRGGEGTVAFGCGHVFAEMWFLRKGEGSAQRGCPVCGLEAIDLIDKGI